MAIAINHSLEICRVWLLPCSRGGPVLLRRFQYGNFKVNDLYSGKFDWYGFVG